MQRIREKIDPSQLDIKDTVVSINRVTKVVKGGKNLSFSALVVVGDGHGVVGFGVGKAKEVPSAIKKGIEAAKKGLIRVPLQGTTIPHTVVGKFGSGAVLLKPAPDGTGIIAGGAVRAVVESAGLAERADEVAGIGQPAQRGARHVRRADVAEGSGHGGPAARQGSGGDDGDGEPWLSEQQRNRDRRQAPQGEAGEKHHRLRQEAGEGRAGPGAEIPERHRRGHGHPGDARHDSQGPSLG